MRRRIPPPSHVLAVELLVHLKRTQALVVWVREDIVAYALGSKAVRIEDEGGMCLHKVGMGEKEASTGNIDIAIKGSGKERTSNLAQFDLDELTECLEEWFSEHPHPPAKENKKKPYGR